MKRLALIGLMLLAFTSCDETIRYLTETIDGTIYVEPTEDYLVVGNWTRLNRMWMYGWYGDFQYYDTDTMTLLSDGLYEVDMDAGIMTVYDLLNGVEAEYIYTAGYIELTLAPIDSPATVAIYDRLY